MGRVSAYVLQMLLYEAQLLISEEDEPMEEDGKANGNGKDEDDLAKYNLDDYDKDSKSIGV